MIIRSPYPNFGRIRLVDNGGRGNYNPLDLKLTKKYSNGLSALVSYTYAKSIDETSGNAGRYAQLAVRAEIHFLVGDETTSDLRVADSG